MSGYTKTKKHILLNCELVEGPCQRFKCPFYSGAVTQEEYLRRIIGKCKLYDEPCVFEQPRTPHERTP